jgi:hypothetical protein
MSRLIDLDAARAARAEAQGEVPTVRFGGVDWKLPAELPWALAEAAASGRTEDAMGAVKSLLGEQWPEFVKLNPTIEDVRILLEGIGTVYVGEDAAGK